MTAQHHGKVCKESMQCVQTRVLTHSHGLTAKGRARHKKWSRCACALPSRALHTFHTLLTPFQKSMQPQEPPQRTPTCSCILYILFILFDKH